MSQSKPSKPPPPVPPHQQPVTTPGSIDDMSSSLLKNVSEEPVITNNNMFGKFQGFTLKPLQKDSGPILNGTKVAYVHPVAKSQDDELSVAVLPNRSAPPVPKPPSISRSQTQPKSTKPVVNRNNTTVLPAKIDSAPALPPFNPGSNPRPLISNPILEGSTCTAKELMSPLKNSNYPVRSAPTAPPVLALDKPTSSSSNTSLHIENEKDKKMGSGTLQKIASFLKKDDKTEKKTATLPRNPSTKRSISIDREKLKNIEISAPIPQVETSEIDSISPSNRVSLNRAQSMRDPVSPTRPNIHTFGSMRQPANLKRPKSFVGTRPKSPPPPRPPAPPEITGLKIPGVPGYQNPPAPKKVIVENNYDDCEAVEAPLAHVSEESSPTSGDNIYAVIEESPLPVVKQTQPNTSADSMGLLSEIVSEIENRNFDSIYSAATLKKKKAAAAAQSDASYANTSDINDDTESEYSNMNPKSNASTTSSGYLRPSAINAPIARVAPTKPEMSNYSTPNSTFSSFKAPEIKNSNNKPVIDNSKSAYKPYSAGFSRTGPLASTYKNTIHKETEKPPLSNTKDSEKIATTKPILHRNKTPPQIQSLRTRSPSPKSAKTSKSLTTNNKNSTDLVSSKTSTSTPANNINSNSIKPKTPQKPTSVQTNNKLENNKIVNRQNSGDKLLNKGTTRLTGANTTTTNNKTNEVPSTNNVASKFLSNNNEITNSKTIGGSGNTMPSTNTGKTLLTNAARPQHGKASNVSSLQQKFETKNNKLKK